MTGVAVNAKPRQRTRVDWGQAKAFYVALSPTERTFAGVAREFRVSSVTVRKHAHADGWVEAAEAADAGAANKALAAAIKTREQRVDAVLRLTDLAVDTAHTKLKADVLDVKLADIPGLVKVSELLLGEATDRVSFAELQEALGVVLTIATEYVPKKARGEFLTAVRARLGAIGSDA